MTGTDLKFIIIAILIVSYIWEEILAYINMQHHQRSLPVELKDRYDPKQYERSYMYHQVSYRFGRIKSAVSTLIMLAVLFWGGFGWLDQFLTPLVSNEILRGLLFLGIVYIVSDILAIPFQWYQTFHIESNFGFNNMTSALFWTDKLKSYLLTTLVGGGVMAILLSLIQYLGENFWLWFWIISSMFILFINIFYTSLIIPLFNKLSPLEEGELRQEIQDYSDSVEFSLDNIYVINGSKRSTRANAFFSGLGKRKKVVLYDTLIDQHSLPELVAVLAHEIGHYKKKHIVQSLFMSILQIGIMLFILSQFVASPILSEALGSIQNSIYLNLLAFSLLYSPISMLTGIFFNLFSRKNEYEADHYAASTYKPEPLAEALIKLHENNLGNLTPHPLYVFVNHSHPTLLQRLKALKS